MSLEREARINSIYLAKGTTNISLVDFTWTFTDDNMPGVESKSGGIVSVLPANLQQGASDEAILAAVDDAQAPFLDQILEVSSLQIEHLYQVGNAEPVNVRPITAEDVTAERERRLALGFDFDFGNARGVHRFATSEDDMRKWAEVTQLSQAAMLAGNPDKKIQISTQTAPTEVTAREWQNVLLAAGEFRQPLFLASFILQAQNPIPADYTADKYWTTAGFV